MYPRDGIEEAAADVPLYKKPISIIIKDMRICRNITVISN